MSQTVLVTGARGTLGRPLVERLRAAGHTVRALSRHGEIPCDLASGEGLAAAVAGASVIVHAATDVVHAQRVDVPGTRRLLELAQREQVAHFIYVSIVGIDKLTAFPYYRAKLNCEQLTQQSGVPWTILRATQFYELLPERIFPRLGMLGPLVVGRGWQIQPVDVREVADRLVQAVAEGPRGLLPDFAGPEIMTWDAIARDWLRSTHSKKPLWVLPLPGRTSRGLQAGATISPDHGAGKLRWSDWLRERFPSS